MSIDYKEAKREIDVKITREWLELAILSENMAMIVIMFATGLPLWLTGLQTIGTLALGGTMVKRYHAGNTAFDEMRALEERTHR